MKAVFAFIVLSLILAAADAVQARDADSVVGQASAVQPNPGLRVGVFDSRFVALAYYRSEYGMKEVRKLQEQMEEARRTGNIERVKALEQKGPALQNLMHQQVFGNLSIPNVLTTLEGRLPQVAADAGVSLIVSKWEVQYAAAGIELLDITSRLVELFDIDDDTRKMIDHVLESGQEPIPLEDLLDPRH